MPLAAIGEQRIEPVSDRGDGGLDLRDSLGHLGRALGAGRPVGHRAVAVIEPNDPGIGVSADADLPVGADPVIWRQLVEQARRGRATAGAGFFQRLGQVLEHAAVRGGPPDPGQRGQRRIRPRHRQRPEAGVRDLLPLHRCVTEHMTAGQPQAPRLHRMQHLGKPRRVSDPDSPHHPLDQLLVKPHQQPPQHPRGVIDRGEPLPTYFLPLDGGQMAVVGLATPIDGSGGSRCESDAVPPL